MDFLKHIFSFATFCWICMLHVGYLRKHKRQLIGFLFETWSLGHQQLQDQLSMAMVKLRYSCRYKWCGVNIRAQANDSMLELGSNKQVVHISENMWQYTYGAFLYKLFLETQFPTNPSHKIMLPSLCICHAQIILNEIIVCAMFKLLQVDKVARLY